MVVLDCSAVIPMVLGNEVGRALRGLMLKGEKVVSSSLLYPEACGGMWKYVRAGLMTPDDAKRRVGSAIALVDEFYGFEGYATEVFGEACRLGHSVYDVFYFVLARRLGATLFTEDRRLIELCEQNGVDCVHIADLVKES